MELPVVQSAEHTVGCEKVWHITRGCMGLEQMVNETRSKSTS